MSPLLASKKLTLRAVVLLLAFPIAKPVIKQWAGLGMGCSYSWRSLARVREWWFTPWHWRSHLCWGHKRADNLHHRFPIRNLDLSRGGSREMSQASLITPQAGRQFEREDITNVTLAASRQAKDEMRKRERKGQAHKKSLFRWQLWSGCSLLGSFSPACFACIILAESSDRKRY